MIPSLICKGNRSNGPKQNWPKVKLSPVKSVQIKSYNQSASKTTNPSLCPCLVKIA